MNTTQQAQKSGLNSSKNGIWKKLDTFRKSPIATLLLSVIIPAITTLTLEWIARGNFAPNNQNNGFWQALLKHPNSFFISYLLLVLMYVFVSQLSGQNWLATIVVGLFGNVPAVVTYYKLTMRGEPFLPWDLSQIGDLMGVQEKVSYEIQLNMLITLVLFIMLTILAGLVKLPRKKDSTKKFVRRLLMAGGAGVAGLALLFGIFLNPAGTKWVGIQEDAWMQDRYYRTNGVLTGFLTNLQLLQISVPDNYSSEAALAIAEEVEQNKTSKPFYSQSYAATTSNTKQQPDIIFVMAESFWDVTELPGIEYDRDLLPNLTALQKEGASGYVYTPSFGGGTCDVEFEALTGFSMEHLPSGSKPFQQYITGETFSLPQVLKADGYKTMAIHGYGRRFWNRDTAYPRLGIDTFIASDDFVNPDMRRGFISDQAMVERIIQEYEAVTANGTPVFIHAVTMQNHTTYSRNRYPADELVKVVAAPASIPDSTIGQLEDCATGIYEMDAALGQLTSYLKTSSRPTIVVFWGDHLNPMSDGHALFEKTGMIEKGDTAAAVLHKTPLLIWSNYANNQVELGTIAAYNLSPVMMDLYGLEKPLMFDYLMQQLPAMHARTRGITINPDNTDSYDMSEEQHVWFNKHSILQYNFLFGDKTLDTYTASE
ncbi:LTA synthase family protein [Ruminococcaceae bacterium OttesenSCG-928-A16]|nr:LTA synthase family protein [Ruminococcaceae bacterium OttesenSCG-928-A16]